ncbi:MAG: metallophosphoesterase, partial [Bdellovibrionales bacterium]|nr:metallophosphoesterase [Bdellovibrionales bacterium]
MIKFILLFTFLFSINLFAHSFNFIAIGDAPYTETGGIDMFKKLVEQINARNPDFTIHVGDIKGGNEKCTDERILKVKKLFDQFNHPLLYTPGDNEWTDCFRASSGSMNPIERLSRIRSLFFTKAESFGQKKLQYVSQATEAKFKKFRENYYFPYKGGLVASVHIVGSNNNLRNEDEEAVKEFHERQVANLAWLDKIFNASKNLKFLILFFHAEIGWGSTKDKFKGYQAVYK